MARKKINRCGNRTFTVKELQDLLPKLEGITREESLKIADKIKMRPAVMDVLRNILGFTKDSPILSVHKQHDAEILQLFHDHPDLSAYELCEKYGKSLGITNYQYFYKVLRRAGEETNRKRNFWTTIKEKKLLFERDVNHRKWSEIALILGRNASTLNSHYMYLKGYHRPEKGK